MVDHYQKKKEKLKVIITHIGALPIRRRKYTFTKNSSSSSLFVFISEWHKVLIWSSRFSFRRLKKLYPKQTNNNVDGLKYYRLGETGGCRRGGGKLWGREGENTMSTHYVKG